MIIDKQFINALSIYTQFQVVAIIIFFLAIIVCIIALASSSQFAHDYIHQMVHFASDSGKYNQEGIIEVEVELLLSMLGIILPFSSVLSLWQARGQNRCIFNQMHIYNNL